MNVEGKMNEVRLFINKSCLESSLEQTTNPFVFLVEVVRIACP